VDILSVTAVTAVDTVRTVAADVDVTHQAGTDTEDRILRFGLRTVAQRAAGVIGTATAVKRTAVFYTNRRIYSRRAATIARRTGYTARP